MEVTATALLCLNTSSRLSCREDSQCQTLGQSRSPNSVSVSSLYLWLREHVQAPGAHFAISGNADQVVCILGPHHVHTVDRVLNTTEHKTVS